MMGAESTANNQGCRSCIHKGSAQSCNNGNDQKAKAWWAEFGDMPSSGTAGPLDCFEASEIEKGLDKLNSMMDNVLKQMSQKKEPSLGQQVEELIGKPSQDLTEQDRKCFEALFGFRPDQALNPEQRGIVSGFTAVLKLLRLKEPRLVHYEMSTGMVDGVLRGWISSTMARMPQVDPKYLRNITPLYTLDLPVPEKSEEVFQCCECQAKATWLRHTQFAGSHPYCDNHAKLEPDFGKDEDSSYWTRINQAG